MWTKILSFVVLFSSCTYIARESLFEYAVVAMIQEAKPEFTRNIIEVEDLILEIQSNPEPDRFEEILLRELKNFREELESYPHLARMRQNES